MTDTIQNAFDRLYAIQSSDEGLYTLAVHSFVEAVIRSRICEESEQDFDKSFYELVKDYKQYLIEEANGTHLTDLHVLQNLMDCHRPTNTVRHNFATLSKDEVLAATQHLVRFCRLADIPATERLNELQTVLSRWNERKPYHILVRENQQLHLENKQLAANQQEASAELSRLRQLQSEQEHFTLQLKMLEYELEDERKKSGNRSDRIDTLRQEQAVLREDLKSKTREIGQLRHVEEMLEALRNQLVMARTRRDYERMVLRLSAEQQTVLSQIRIDSDFLVKGSAGTGKTLVLLKAIEKAKGKGTDKANVQDELDMAELKGPIALLTYTKTLVKYDQWLSGLMLSGVLDRDDRISTVDSYLKTVMEGICPDATYSYMLEGFRALAERYCEGTGLTAQELESEAENYVWAGYISEKEYCMDGIARTGMRTPLPVDKRIAVWRAIEAMKQDMIREKNFSKCAAASYILENNPEAVVDYLFIDEVQDLPAVVLKALRKLTRRSMILAGDADQSIYQRGFSFKRAGIDITGHTRILNANYRNTGPIHDLAEKYRILSGGEPEQKAIAWREGTYPVHLTAPNSKELLETLLDRIKLFIETFDYEPQNLCILAANKNDVGAIQVKLAAEGIATKNIKDDDFDFTSTGSIRLSTMHSAKGLDFPVVFLYLNQHIYCGHSFTPEDTDKQVRNLIYVSLTRAMEHLEVLTKESVTNKPVLDLVGLFG